MNWLSQHSLPVLQPNQDEKPGSHALTALHYSMRADASADCGSHVYLTYLHPAASKDHSKQAEDHAGSVHVCAWAASMRTKQIAFPGPTLAHASCFLPSAHLDEAKDPSRFGPPISLHTNREAHVPGAGVSSRGRQESVYMPHLRIQVIMRCRRPQW